MSVFFVGWELWQKMTFVLACCIVLVFAFGFARQWRTNRVLRRLEIIDEEKRARLSVISHCGIEALRPPGIPFGIRALQSGIRVEGIWIARSNTPDSRHTLPSATLVVHHANTPKGKGNMVDSAPTNSPSIYLASKSSSQNYTPILDLSCRAPSIVPSESPQTLQTSSSHRLNLNLASPQQHSQQNPLKEATHNQLGSGDSVGRSFRNPFVIPTQRSTSSFHGATGTGLESESTTSRMKTIPASHTETCIDRYATRTGRGSLIIPAGFKPEAHSQVAKKAYSEGSGSPYQSDMLPTQTKILSPRHKPRKERISGSGHIASKSAHST